jgi:serine/threonine protein kinase
VMSGEAYDVRADVYSLAMTLYELVAQKTPFASVKQVTFYDDDR